MQQYNNYNNYNDNNNEQNLQSNPYIYNENINNETYNSYNNAYDIQSNKTVSSNNDYMIKQQIYDSVVNYFGDIIMTKLNTKSTSDGTLYGLYYCRVGCMLCVDNRYILVIVKEESDNIQVGTQMYLSNLNWISFQTRSIDEFETVNPYNIKIKQQNVTNKRNTIIDMEMKLLEELDDRVRYECSHYFPIIVDIMKKKVKEKNIYDMMEGYEKEYYTQTCSLQTLFESYQCVLTIN
jgi:hypothetical protein